WVATMIASSHPLKRCAETFDERSRPSAAITVSISLSSPDRPDARARRAAFATRPRRRGDRVKRPSLKNISNNSAAAAPGFAPLRMRPVPFRFRSQNHTYTLVTFLGPQLANEGVAAAPAAFAALLRRLAQWPRMNRVVKLRPLPLRTKQPLFDRALLGRADLVAGGAQLAQAIEAHVDNRGARDRALE